MVSISEAHTIANSPQPMLMLYEPYMLGCALFDTIVDYAN
jgi:hypothetical protein